VISKILASFHENDRGVLVAHNFPTNFYAKRSYAISTYNAGTIRAWHAHKSEEKIFYCRKGRGVLSLIKIDDFNSPAEYLPIERYVLDDQEKTAIYVPGGYAHGIAILANESEFVVHSNFTLEDSEKDTYRYSPDFWAVLDSPR